jgi:hypothetical protein
MMASYTDQKTALLAAAQQAKDIGSYLDSFPGDRSVIESLRSAASRISEAARALDQEELQELSINLTYTASGTFSTARGVAKLNRLVSRIFTIAEALVQHR